MRALIYILSACAVIVLGFWAYQENYKTQEAIKEVRHLHRQIGVAHERLGMLHAEWAYLNRPDRLLELAETNFDRLGLLPLMPEAFKDVGQIIFPLPEIQPFPPIDIDLNVVPDQGEAL